MTDPSHRRARKVAAGPQPALPFRPGYPSGLRAPERTSKNLAQARYHGGGRTVNPDLGGGPGEGCAQARFLKRQL